MSNIIETLPDNVIRTTFFSYLYNRALAYCIYLPPDYGKGDKSYPVHYHFHGWQGNETSDIFAMEPLYQNGDTIFVFPNISDELGDQNELPVERMVFEELFPEIERAYRVTDERTVSGFSMGGGMAVWYAVKHPGVFSDVIAYAGTFHHYYHKDFMTPFEPIARAEELYRGMLGVQWESERNLLALFAKTSVDTFRLELRIGTYDPLYCDAEVLHMYLTDIGFAHTYHVIDGVGHVLGDIVTGGTTA